MLYGQNMFLSYIKFISCQLFDREVSKYKPTMSNFCKMSAETSHKGKNKKAYNMQLKQDVARYTNENSNR